MATGKDKQYMNGKEDHAVYIARHVLPIMQIVATIPKLSFVHKVNEGIASLHNNVFLLITNSFITFCLVLLRRNSNSI